MRKNLLIAALFIVQSITATPVELMINEGRVFYKEKGDTVWSIKDQQLVVNPGDTIKSTGSDKVVLSAAAGLRFMLSSETSVLFNKGDKLIVELVKGQVLFDRTDKTPFGVTAKWCEFIPKGTAAAVKINKKDQASVAVLRGDVNMKAPTGIEQVVPAGSFSSYNAATSSFAPIKKLPESALKSLESYSGIELPSEPASEKIQENTDKTENQEAAITEEEASTAKTVKSEEVSEKEEINQESASSASTDSKEKSALEQKGPVLSPGEESSDKNDDSGKMEKDSQKSSDDLAVKENGGNTSEEDEQAIDSTSAENKNEDKKDESHHKPVWEISAGMVTIDDEQWTRIAVAVDVPLWRFGVCFDLEMFLDSRGSFSNRGWNFSDGRSAGQSLLRKIRYIRFNKEGDPLFIKVGGLDGVSYGYGFILDNMTNMLDYPGEKLFGVQFDINDITPVGLTLRTMIPDVMDFGNDGGMIFNQLGFRPMKSMNKKILSGIRISGIFAADFNQYAPARDWDYTLSGSAFDLDEDGIQDSTNVHDIHYDPLDTSDYYQKVVAKQKAANAFDTIIEHKDKWASRAEDKFMMLGGDLVVPIIDGKIIKFDIYGQVALALSTDDSTTDKTFKGWGIGAPGAHAKFGPVWAQVEYRHARDQFQPGYFNYYYLKERIVRTNNGIWVKEDKLTEDRKNGVFGKLGFNINDFLVIEGAYQWMKGDGYKRDLNSPNSLDSVRNIDQRFSANAGVGNVLLSKIPKINKIEAFYDQRDIDSNIFKKSLTTYWGYRVGVEVLKGAGIIWETRYGWRYEGSKLVDDKQVRIQAALSF